jgi:S-adenosyl-L-methionine hydrolase (adenosine-forming)
MSRIITLTTDFGTKDWFVGSMKGVILSIQPEAAVTDITHDVSTGDIRGGAFALAASYPFFPRGTIHLAVVDPGVGSDRPAIVVQTADYLFIGPDNGVLSWALRQEQIKAIRKLENERFFLRSVSHTFHGRDIFAPVAAHLSKGVPMEKLGPAQPQLVTFPWPKPQRTRREVTGEVLYIDRFGNAITNIRSEFLDGFDRESCRVMLRRKAVARLKRYYEQVPPGQAACVSSSSGFLEIAVNGGSAAQRFKLKVGDPVEVRRATQKRSS